jgi:hypothetical protein
MSKFTQVKATKDITVNGIVIVRQGTKGTILRFNENPFVRFSTGRMIEIPTNLLLAL